MSKLRKKIISHELKVNNVSEVVRAYTVIIKKQQNRFSPLDRQGEVYSAVKAAEADTSRIYDHNQTHGQIVASDENISLIVWRFPTSGCFKSSEPWEQ